MGGMELMLKSFGLDPKAIQKQVGEFGQIVVALKEQMDRIEAQNIRIENLLLQQSAVNHEEKSNV